MKQIRTRTSRAVQDCAGGKKTRARVTGTRAWPVRRCARTRGRTDGSCERALRGVRGTHVSGPVAARAERQVAEPTRERHVPGVHGAHVQRRAALLRAAVAADRAGVRLATAVTSEDVPRQVGLPDGLELALGAGKPALPGVRRRVDLQVGPLARREAALRARVPLLALFLLLHVPRDGHRRRQRRPRSVPVERAQPTRQLRWWRSRRIGLVNASLHREQPKTAAAEQRSRLAWKLGTDLQARRRGRRRRFDVCSQDSLRVGASDAEAL
jgi:hypothetical protein